MLPDRVSNPGPLTYESCAFLLRYAADKSLIIPSNNFLSAKCHGLLKISGLRPESKTEPPAWKSDSLPNRKNSRLVLPSCTARQYEGSPKRSVTRLIFRETALK